MRAKKTYALAFLMVLLYSTNAQTGKEASGSHEYRNAIGIRAASTAGLTYKHFSGTGNAFEFILGLWPNAVGLTALYEKHAAAGRGGLKFYYGGGAHATFETGSYLYRRNRNHGRDYVYRYGDDGYGIGIDGVAGFEYKFRPIPLALSFDVKPFVEVSNYGDIYIALDAGLGVKLAF